MEEYIDWCKLFRMRNRPIDINSPLEVNYYNTKILRPIDDRFEAYREDGAIVYLPSSEDQDDVQVCIIRIDGSLENLLTLKRGSRVMVYDDLLWLDEEGSPDILLYDPKSQSVLAQFPKWSSEYWRYVIVGNRAVHTTPQAVYLSRYDEHTGQFVDLLRPNLTEPLRNSYITKYYYILHEDDGRTTVYDNHKALLRFDSISISVTRGRYLIYSVDTYKLLNMRTGKVRDLGPYEPLSISSIGLIALYDRENNELILYDIETNTTRRTGIEINEISMAVFSNDGTALFLRSNKKVCIVTVPLKK